MKYMYMMKTDDAVKEEIGKTFFLTVHKYLSFVQSTLL